MESINSKKSNAIVPEIHAKQNPNQDYESAKAFIDLEQAKKKESQMLAANNSNGAKDQRHPEQPKNSGQQYDRRASRDSTLKMSEFAMNQLKENQDVSEKLKVERSNNVLQARQQRSKQSLSKNEPESVSDLKHKNRASKPNNDPLLDRLNYVIEKKEKPRYYSDNNGDKRHQQQSRKVSDNSPNITNTQDHKKYMYNEYLNNFQEHKKDGHEEMANLSKANIDVLMRFVKMDGPLEGEVCVTEDDQMNKRRVKLLHEERVRMCERNFMNIVFKSNFEKLDTWKPTNFILKFIWWVVYFWFRLKKCAQFIIKQPLFEAITITVIIVNSIFLALENPEQTLQGIQEDWERMVEYVFQALYTTEMILKILGLGFIIGEGTYLQDHWNILDFIVVVSAWIPIVVGGGGFNLNALRSFRVLRPLRTISSIKNLRALIQTIFNAVPYLLEVIYIMIFVFLIFGIAGLQLFFGILKRRCFELQSGIVYSLLNGGTDGIVCNGTSDCPAGFICGKMMDNPDYNVQHFDNLANSMLMVFQVTTMEGWTAIMINLQRAFTPIVIIYFILLVFIGNFFLLNQLLGVIIVKFNEAQNEIANEEREASLMEIEISKIFPKVEGLKRENDYKEGLELAILKQNHEQKLIYLSKIEKKKFMESPGGPEKYFAGFASNKNKQASLNEQFEKVKMSDSDKMKLNENEYNHQGHQNPVEPMYANVNQNPRHTTSSSEQKISFHKKNTTAIDNEIEDSSIPIIHSANISPDKKILQHNGDDSSKQNMVARDSMIIDLSKSGSINNFNKQNSKNDTPKNSSYNPFDKNDARNGDHDPTLTPTILRKPSDVQSGTRVNGGEDEDLNEIGTLKENKKDSGQSNRNLQSLSPIVKDRSEKPDTPEPNMAEPLSSDIRKHHRQIDPNYASEERFGPRSADTQRPHKNSEENKNTHKQKLGNNFEISDEDDSSKMVKTDGVRLDIPKASNKLENDVDFQIENEYKIKISAIPAPNNDSVKSIRKSQMKKKIAFAGEKTGHIEKVQEVKFVEDEHEDANSKNDPNGQDIQHSMKSVCNLSQNSHSVIMDMSQTTIPSGNSKKKAKKGKKPNKSGCCSASLTDLEKEEKKKKNLIRSILSTKSKYLKMDIAYNLEYTPLEHFNSIIDVATISKAKIEKDEQRKFRKKQKCTHFDIEYKRLPDGKKNKRDKKNGDENGNENISYMSGYDGSSSGSTNDRSSMKSDKMQKQYVSEKTRNIIEDNDYLGYRKCYPISTSERAKKIIEQTKKIADKKSQLRKTSAVTNGRASTIMDDNYNPKVQRLTFNIDRFNDQDRNFKLLFNGYEDDEQMENNKDTKSIVEKVLENKVDRTFEPVYLSILEGDVNTKTIANYNWSGRDCCPKTTLTDSKIDRVHGELNDHEESVWLSGWKGAYILSRKYIKNFMMHILMENFLMMCVLGNTVVLALDGSVSEEQEQTLDNINLVFTYIFGVEMVLKLYGYGPKGYAADAFNIFDGVIVIISFVDLIITEVLMAQSETPTVCTIVNGVETCLEAASGGGSSFSAFRAIRIFRVFRVMRVSRILRGLMFMKVIIEVLSGAIEQFILITFQLFLMMFIMSLQGMQFFGAQLNFPDAAFTRMNFDSQPNAFLTVFQVLTLENWTDILYNCMRSSVSSIITIIYLLAWIFIGNFIFLNLFMTIQLDGFGSSEAMTINEEIENEKADLDAIHAQKIEENMKMLTLSNKAKKENKLVTESMYKSDGNKNENLEGQEISQIEKSMALVDGVFLNPDFILNADGTFLDKYYHLNEMDFEFTEDDYHEFNMLINQKVFKIVKKPSIYEGVECEMSLFIFSKKNKFRRFCARITSYDCFELIILVLIVLSSLCLVMETYKTVYWSDTLVNVFFWLDIQFNIQFIIEAMMKIVRMGFFICSGSYQTDNWCILDFIIVSCSIIDMSFAGVKLTVVRVLRLLRTLRALRFISHNQNMKVLVNAQLGSFGAILNVGVVIMMIWIMFAILAISFLKNEMGYCDIEEYYNVSKQTCELFGNTWKNYPWNFDNLANSFVTLFVQSTQEGWPNIMTNVFDASPNTSGPVYSANAIFGAIFFICFIFVSAFFLINLFLGVLFFQFSLEQDNERKEKFKYVTIEQLKWIQMQDLIANAKHDKDQLFPPKNRFRNWFYQIAIAGWFETGIILCIIFNIIVMGMAFDGMSPGYIEILGYINLCFTGIFILEMIQKIYGLGMQYFKSNWNNFDCIIVWLSIVDICLDYFIKVNLSFLRSAPQIARVLRVLRLFKLMKRKEFEGLKKILKTVIFGMPALINVLALLSQVYFIFAVLGVFLFEDVPYDSYVNNDIVNFNNFGNALIVLFRCSTGEDWQLFMYHYSDATPLMGYPYFLFYILLSSFIMLNMFTLVVTQQFEETYFNPDNPISSFEELSETFTKAWRFFTTHKNKGVKIKERNLVELFSFLRPPIGYRYVEDENEEEEDDYITDGNIPTVISRQDISRAIFKMEVPVDKQGYVCFGVAQHIAMKNAYGKRYMLDIEKDAYKVIRKAELVSLAEIMYKYNMKKRSGVRLNLSDINQTANPFLEFIQVTFVKMSFKSWKKLSIDLINAKIECETRGMPFSKEKFFRGEYGYGSPQNQSDILDKYNHRNLFEENYDDDNYVRDNMKIYDKQSFIEKMDQNQQLDGMGVHGNPGNSRDEDHQISTNKSIFFHNKKIRRQ